MTPVWCKTTDDSLHKRKMKPRSGKELRPLLHRMQKFRDHSKNGKALLCVCVCVCVWGGGDVLVEVDGGCHGIIEGGISGYAED
jgi:hypothetical protein